MIRNNFLCILLEKKRTSITRLKHKRLVCRRGWRTSLEKKRTSITRLKLDRISRVAWNNGLEKKRTSITRLKHWGEAMLGLMTGAWKEKNLDYEIETRKLYASYVVFCSTWKEKNLDYEIETCGGDRLCMWYSVLKRKEPRLRDWNSLNSLHNFRHDCLEKKRTSITRLKQWSGKPPKPAIISCLEKKRTSITRLKRRCIVDGKGFGQFLEKKRTSITRLKQIFEKQCQ